MTCLDSPDKREASRMLQLRNIKVPKMFTKKTQRAVPKVFPLPVTRIMNAIRRSNAGARLMDRANRGTLIHVDQWEPRNGRVLELQT